MPSGPRDSGECFSRWEPLYAGRCLFSWNQTSAVAQLCCIRTSGTNRDHHPASGHTVLLSPDEDIKAKSWLFCSAWNTSRFLSSRECKYIAKTPWAQGSCFVQVCTMAIALWAPLRLVPRSSVDMGHQGINLKQVCSWLFLWENSIVTDEWKIWCLLKLLLRNRVLQLT